MPIRLTQGATTTTTRRNNSGNNSSNNTNTTGNDYSYHPLESANVGKEWSGRVLWGRMARGS